MLDALKTYLINFNLKIYSWLATQEWLTYADCFVNSWCDGKDHEIEYR